MIGYLDGVTRRKVRGWAVLEGELPPKLLASVNGTIVSHFEASLCRPDLATSGQKGLGFDENINRSLNIGDVVSVTSDRGEHLEGSPMEIDQIQATKEDKALWLVSNDMKILEIGPSYNPIAPRSQGWRTFSLDHASHEELREKYRGQQNVDRIERVDYVWKGGAIETAIPNGDHGTFDVIIASHVLEHIPDPIAFFHSAHLLLKDRGLVSLILPDKRFMFDFFKPVTNTGDYLSAHHFKRTRHSKKTAFDNIAYNVAEKGDIAWYTRTVGDFNFFGDSVLLQAKDAFDRANEDESGPYVDFHATVYTPSSFALIVLELSQLGVLPFSIATTFPTSNCEFYITLRKEKPPELSDRQLQRERLQLMKAVIRELGQQARWLLDSD